MKNGILLFIAIISFSTRLTANDEKKNLLPSIHPEKQQLHTDQVIGEEKVTPTDKLTQSGKNLKKTGGESYYRLRSFRLPRFQDTIATKAIEQLFHDMYISRYDVELTPVDPNVDYQVTPPCATYTHPEWRLSLYKDAGFSQSGFTKVSSKGGVTGYLHVDSVWTRVMFKVDKAKMQALFDAMEREAKNPNAVKKAPLLSISPEKQQPHTDQVISEEKNTPTDKLTQLGKELKKTNGKSHYSLSSSSLSQDIIATEAIEQLFHDMYASRDNGKVSSYKGGGRIKWDHPDGEYSHPNAWTLYLYKDEGCFRVFIVDSIKRFVVFKVDKAKMQALFDAMELEAKNPKKELAK